MMLVKGPFLTMFFFAFFASFSSKKNMDFLSYFYVCKIDEKKEVLFIENLCLKSIIIYRWILSLIIKPLFEVQFIVCCVVKIDQVIQEQKAIPISNVYRSSWVDSSQSELARAMARLLASSAETSKSQTSQKFKIFAKTYSNMSRRSWLRSWYSKIEDLKNQKSGLTRVYSSPARSKPI